jgi:hypothetical protein
VNEAVKTEIFIPLVRERSEWGGKRAVKEEKYKMNDNYKHRRREKEL